MNADEYRWMNKNVTHIVHFSGGVGSWQAAKRVAAKYGTANLVLLFCDTLCEDEDLYRFLYEAHANVGGELVQLCDGRTIWQVFRDERFVSGPHGAACTRALKAEISDAYVQSHYTPDNCVHYVGFDWTEVHRMEGDGRRRVGLRKLKLPWIWKAPMCEPPYLSKEHMLYSLEREGIRRPRMYSEKFSHNNCGGTCVRAGLGHWAHLLEIRPDKYAEAEREESAWMADGINITILKWRSGPNKGRPMTLREYREYLQSGGECDMFDIGGCACFAT